MHADNYFTIPAQSEVVLIGKLSSMLKGINTESSEICGLVYLSVIQFLKRLSS